MSDYTPGPWTYELDVVDEGDINVFSADPSEGLPGLPIAGIDVRTDRDTDDGPPREVALANARLIAAAPDLLEACAKAETGIEDWRLGRSLGDRDDLRQMTASDGYLRSVLGALRSAIAKAKDR